MIDSNSLITWFKQNKRDLPWRHTTNPYFIYISEIMLQQTRAESVIPYYNRFINELPTIESLANVDNDKLLKLWEGLGYYSRAKNLKQSAIMIVQKFNGLFPKVYEELIQLKGIGEYTAGAILSRAFNLPYAAIDGNALRVLSRLNEDSRDISLNKTKQAFKKEIESMNIQEFNIFNEALMELGATVCTFKTPKCTICPFNLTCKAYQNNTIMFFPNNQRKIQKKHLNYTCIFLCNQKNQFYFKIKEEGVLKDLYSPILIDSHLTVQQLSKFISSDDFQIKEIFPLSDQKHIFTHQTWHMKGYLLKVNSKNSKNFYSIYQIKKQINIPICFQKFFKELNIN